LCPLGGTKVAEAYPALTTRLQPGSVTVSGPSVVMWSATLQSTPARATSIEAVAMFVAVMSIASVRGMRGAAPHVWIWVR
jgi:hypothetical protein